jgi:hypothetical protein
MVLANVRVTDEATDMSPSADAKEPERRAASKGGKLSALKLSIQVRHDDIALIVEVDGLKVVAEACVACPHGLVSILGATARRNLFCCEGAAVRCASARIAHSFNVERRGDELIWTRTNYPAGSSSVSFDHHQACVAVCQALLELKAAVDAHPDGIASCAAMMPGKFTYDELLSCIEQSKLLVAQKA